jgi:hypothetical protein
MKAQGGWTKDSPLRPVTKLVFLWPVWWLFGPFNSKVGETVLCKGYFRLFVIQTTMLKLQQCRHGGWLIGGHFELLSQAPVCWSSARWPGCWTSWRITACGATSATVAWTDRRPTRRDRYDSHSWISLTALAYYPGPRSVCAALVCYWPSELAGQHTQIWDQANKWLVNSNNLTRSLNTLHLTLHFPCSSRSPSTRTMRRTALSSSSCWAPGPEGWVLTWPQLTWSSSTGTLRSTYRPWSVPLIHPCYWTN